MTGRARSLGTALLLALAAPLGGCVAVALPVIAGGAIARSEASGDDEPSSPASAAVTPGPAEAQATEPAEGEPDADRETTRSGEEGAYDAFFAFAEPRGGRGTTENSMVLAAPTLTRPQLVRCDRREPAVLIDLDPAGVVFDPAVADALPAPGLAEGLARLREAGLVVLWVSESPLETSEDIYDALRRSGLDPDGTDRLLLPRRAGERKQTRRADAARQWCVVAIAGDRRADFDELFDYLIDPAAAAGLEPLFGRGWFIVPPPLV